MRKPANPLSGEIIHSMVRKWQQQPNTLSPSRQGMRGTVEQVRPGQTHELEEHNPAQHRILHLIESSGRLHARHNRHFSLVKLCFEL